MTSSNVHGDNSHALMSKSDLAKQVKNELIAIKDTYFSSDHPPLPPIDIDFWVNYRSLGISRKTVHPAKLFPSYQEWDSLSSGITSLARMSGRKQMDFGDLPSCAYRIEHDYKHNHFSALIDALCKKVDQIPVPPLTALARLIQSSANSPDRKTAVELYVLLGGNLKMLPENCSDLLLQPDAALKAFGPLLSRLSSSSFKTVPLSNLPIPPRTALMLTLENVTGQQARWKQYYQKDFSATAQWMYGLQLEKTDAALRRILHGQAPLVPEMQVKLKKAARHEQTTKTSLEIVTMMRDSIRIFDRPPSLSVTFCKRALEK